jgi:hypothetical protein
MNDEYMLSQGWQIDEMFPCVICSQLVGYPIVIVHCSQVRESFEGVGFGIELIANLLDSRIEL